MKSFLILLRLAMCKRCIYKTYYGSVYSGLYTGKISQTMSGTPCQRWDASWPHRPSVTPVTRNHNYCRNPDNDPLGPWCYTTDGITRYEYCSIPICRSQTTVREPTVLPCDGFLCDGRVCVNQRNSQGLTHKCICYDDETYDQKAKICGKRKACHMTENNC